MSKRRVLLIILPYVVKGIDADRSKIRSFLAFPYGALAIASYCSDLAEFKIIDCDTIADHALVIHDTLQEFQPHIVGFSMMFDNSYPHLETLLHLTRRVLPSAITMLGGAAASYSYKEIMAELPELDMLCYAEGEQVLRSFLRDTNRLSPSIVTRGTLAAGLKPFAFLANDIDIMTELDYSLVDPSAYDMQEAFSPFARPNRKCFFLLTSRGCFGNCAFCSNGELHGKVVRQASVGCIVDHVEHLVVDYGMETLIIYDDQLLYKPKRAKALFRQLAQFNIRIEAPNGVSVRYVDQEMADLMRGAGMDTIYLAIESGSPYVLKELIDKPLELSMVEPAVTALRKADFFIHAFIVLGMPGETAFHRNETWCFLRESDIDWAGINLATPVRGSRLYRDCIKNGWIKEQKMSDVVDKEYIINYPGTNTSEVEVAAYLMNLDINFHHNRRMRVGDYETAAKCFEQVLDRYKGHSFAHQYLMICYRETWENESNTNVHAGKSKPD